MLVYNQITYRKKKETKCASPLPFMSIGVLYIYIYIYGWRALLTYYLWDIYMNGSRDCGKTGPVYFHVASVTVKCKNMLR